MLRHKYPVPERPLHFISHHFCNSVLLPFPLLVLAILTTNIIFSLVSSLSNRLKIVDNFRRLINNEGVISKVGTETSEEMERVEFEERRTIVYVIVIIVVF